PNRFQSAVEEAFYLYSNGGENEIQAPNWEESYERFIEAFHKLNEVAPNPESIDMNDDLDRLKLFVNAYQQFDKTYGAIQVYMEYNEEAFSQKFGLNPDKIEDYHGKYENALEIIRKNDEDNPDEITIDFDYQLSEVGKQQIDYEYLMLLMQSIVNEPTAKSTDKRLKDVEVHLAKFKESNPKLGELVDEVWREALFMGTNATD
ncbi:type I restriction endonuclease subunit R, EcoR124 family, partial [Aerococcus tenax]